MSSRSSYLRVKEVSSLWRLRSLLSVMVRGWTPRRGCPMAERRKLSTLSRDLFAGAPGQILGAIGLEASIFAQAQELGRYCGCCGYVGGREFQVILLN
jgi:hypothetical protein